MGPGVVRPLVGGRNESWVKEKKRNVKQNKAPFGYEGGGTDFPIPSKLGCQGGGGTDKNKQWEKEPSRHPV